MKKTFAFAAAFALFASTQAFAIAGIGAHYVMNTGSLEPSTGGVNIAGPGNVNIPVTVNQESISGLQGLGFKAWLDILPFVDIEGTFNMAFATYHSAITMPGGAVVPIEVDLGIPFYGKASPVFSKLNGDLSVTYPFTMLPIIRPYLGAGISYIITTRVVNSSFIGDFMNSEAGKKIADGFITDPTDIDESELAESLTSFVKDKGMTKGLGGHILAGFRIKLPVIPIAAYANGKYYFGGNLPKQFSNGFVLEVGGGFAL